jgi:CheY-like chemotaxis protein
MSREPVVPIDGTKVLVIEDNEDLRTVFALCLENAGAEVRTAESGVDAFDVLKKWIPDVVFCDLHMPTMDGWQFVATMRQKAALRRLPTIAVTGAAADVALLKERGGFQGHMLKPVTAAALAKKVSQLTAKAGRPKAPRA